MKKIILFLLVILAFNSNSQTGAATASAQTRSNLLLKYSVDKQDSIYTAVKTFTNMSIANTVTTTVAQYTITPATSSVTISGTVTTGAKGILFETSSDFSGTIDGLLFGSSGFLSYPIVVGSTYVAVPYTISAGTLYIRKFN